MENKPVCYEPEYRHPEIFSGVPSFLGLPPVHTVDKLGGYDFVIMGVPWEGICTYGGPSGTENATKTIRRASERYGSFLPELDFDVFDYFSGCDFGDSGTKNGDIEFTFKHVMKHMRNGMSHGGIPIVFGGDHSLSYPLIKVFAEKYDGKIGIIHFDAHMDNLDRYGNEKFARCSPFHRLYYLEGFNPRNLVSIGIRGPRNHYDALKEARKHGASFISSFEVKQKGAVDCIRKAIEIASSGTKAFYVSVCSDALDISCNPGGPIDFCGLSSYELGLMLYECGLAGAKAFDYMEVYPPLDSRNISSHCACWMAIYIMNGMAKHKLTG